MRVEACQLQQFDGQWVARKDKIQNTCAASQALKNITSAQQPQTAVQEEERKCSPLLMIPPYLEVSERGCYDVQSLLLQCMHVRQLVCLHLRTQCRSPHDDQCTQLLGRNMQASNAAGMAVGMHSAHHGQTFISTYHCDLPLLLRSNVHSPCSSENAKLVT
jgi:hypothetical protein